MTDAHWGAIKAAVGDGVTYGKLARRFGISYATVQRWANRDTPPSETTRRKPAKDSAKRIATRRKRVRALALKTQVVERTSYSPVRRKPTTRSVTIRPFNSAIKIARALKDVTPKTIQRDLHALGLTNYKRPSGPFLTPQNKAYRVRIAKLVVKFTNKQLANLMFTDEKWFDTQTKRVLSYWDIAPTSEGAGVIAQEERKNKLLLIGFISANHRRLKVVDADAIDSECYRRELEAYKAVLKRHCLVQDNAPAHAALVRSKYFARRGIRLLPWPPYSPDLNPIETLWAWLAADVERGAPFGKEELSSFIFEAWGRISQVQLRRLALEFKERCQVCIEGGGALVTRSLLRRFRAKSAKAGKKAPSARAGRGKRAGRG